MNYSDAVRAYKQDASKKRLDKIVKKLTEEMTLKEKIYMLSGHPIRQIQRDLIKTGRNYNVHALPAGGCKRLGIPPILFTDGPRGVVMGNSTCFPSSMLRASAFDTDLEYRIGKAMAGEAIAQGANYFAGICINLVRNPKWGRCQESYGEDTFLLGIFGEALTRSVQEEGLIACPKHFALNSMEDLRFYVDVKIDDRSLHEVYLPHFKKCIDAGAQSVMGAYNRYDEFYCCENRKLLTDILRKEWGFDGFVMSDFVWGIHDAEHSLRAGCDVEMMFSKEYTQGKIKKCLKKGKLNEGHIDRAVQNILRALIRQQPRIKKRSMDIVGCKENRALALEAAQKGMVLLENNGVLPLGQDASVVVCGAYADVENTGDHGSSRVYDKQIVTPYQGIRKKFADVALAAGMDAGAIKQAGKDVVILCVGNDYKSEGEYFANMNYALTEKPEDGGGDRRSLRLSEKEAALIKNLKKSGKKVVVVLYSGGAVMVDEWRESADAIIMNYYSGCEGGTALAALISGEVNFTGHLPFTIAQKEEDYPDFRTIGQKPYVIDYGYYHGYTLLDKLGKKAAYPFGYGLSYTDFTLREGKIACKEDGIDAVILVKNTGKVAGAQVIQLYAGSRDGGKERPVKLLKGIGRVELKPGEEKEVKIHVPKEELKFYDGGKWVLDKEYDFYIGTDCEEAMNRKYRLALG